MDNWQAMAEFCRFDKMTGGPDSHMTTVVKMSEGESLESKGWRALVYAAVYNVPMAQVIWERCPEPAGVRELASWVELHWRQIVLRRERKRCLLTPHKLMTCLQSAADWLNVDRIQSAKSYDELWKAADEIKFFGRYAKIKSLECLRRMGLTEHMIPDLRAHDAKSPRQGLAILWPEYVDLLLHGGNEKYTVLATVENLASETIARLRRDYGVELNCYEMQTLVCDFKQVVHTARQYPGRSVDSEFTYYQKVTDNFPLDRSMFEARRALFPEWSLAEVQGWNGVREELGPLFVKQGYMWTDSVYDYNATKDLSQPVKR